MPVTKLTSDDLTKLSDDWEFQCRKYGASLEDFAPATYPTLRGITSGALKAADMTQSAVWALHDGDSHKMVFATHLYNEPSKSHKTLKVRHILFCPDLDYGEHSDDVYENLQIEFIAAVINSGRTAQANEVKFHISGAGDRTFFSNYSKIMASTGIYRSVKLSGMWLDIIFS
jgi:hypothetical protein